MPFPRAKKTWDEAALYEYAIGALGRRMRSVAELKRLMRQRLRGVEGAEEMMDAVVRRLKEQRYLDDANYAAFFSSLRRDNDKFGRRRVITDLKQRGVHPEVIEKAVGGAFEGVNEEKQARQYLRRKRLVKPANDREAARIFRALVRAGFGTRTVISILKKWDVEDEVLTALESEEQ
jgi:regulatory protein